MSSDTECRGWHQNDQAFPAIRPKGQEEAATSVYKPLFPASGAVFNVLSFFVDGGKMQDCDSNSRALCKGENKGASKTQSRGCWRLTGRAQKEERREPSGQ